jgi:ABC-type phosphate/phosphonate transport system substrate-binding protein
MKRLLSCVSLLGAVAACSAAEPVTPAAPNPERSTIRVAFSQSQFAGVNQNDAHAAMKVYFKSIAEDSGMAVDVTQLPMEGTRAIAEVLRDHRADLLAMTTEEFLVLEGQGLAGPLLLTGVKKEFTEEYLLLTHAESAIRNVGDLKGRSLLLSSEIRASLARRWLEVLCYEHGLGAAEQALGKITAAAKPTLVVLPVFFRQADACILTRHGFDVMGEMNPQVKKQLRVLAVSKPMVSTLSCFRRGFSESLKQRVIEAALKSQGKPAFEQVMILFKSDGLTQEPVSALASARELLATHARLCSSTNGAAAPLLGASASNQGDDL